MITETEIKAFGWGYELTPDESGIGLESLNMGPGERQNAPYFKPVNIVVEQGIIYATVYVCHLAMDQSLYERFCIWLAGLKDTDHIKLTLCSTRNDILYSGMIDLLAAVANTNAKIDAQLNQVVADGLAYFYLLADTVTVGAFGALYIPSYNTQRQEHSSIPWQAVHDFYQWIVEEAVLIERLTESEAKLLNNGSHVILPNDRF